MSAAWIAVACAEHVRRGKEGGFVQVCHGKAPYRSFTAAGLVAEGEPYGFDMGAGFQPWRRDVRWSPTHEAPIAPLLDRLAFTAGKTNWGYQLRFGLIAVERVDFELILAAMTHNLTDVSQALGGPSEHDRAMASTALRAHALAGDGGSESGADDEEGRRFPCAQSP
jgi:hypothetical protein